VIVPARAKHHAVERAPIDRAVRPDRGDGMDPRALERIGEQQIVRREIRCAIVGRERDAMPHGRYWRQRTCGSVGFGASRRGAWSAFATNRAASNTICTSRAYAG